MKSFVMNRDPVSSSLPAKDSVGSASRTATAAKGNSFLSIVVLFPQKPHVNSFEAERNALVNGIIM